MARSIWNGTITFGLISVPIKVHSATEDRSVHFHQVHAKDGAQIKQKRVCAKDGKEVPYKQVAKGYEVRSGEYVLLSQDEIAAAAGERSRLIELEEFVRAPEIDPVYFDKTYYLGAGAEGADAYRLLHDALQKSDRAGIGRWVFHNREYLVAIRSLDDVLALHTMRFADELVSPDEVDVPSPSRSRASARSRWRASSSTRSTTTSRRRSSPTATASGCSRWLRRRHGARNCRRRLT